jgi:hypothetical protein
MYVCTYVRTYSILWCMMHPVLVHCWEAVTMFSVAALFAPH